MLVSQYVRLFAIHGLQPCHAPLSMDFSVGSHALLQEIFPTWGWNPGFWHFRQIPYHLNHLGLLTRAAGS